MRNRSWICGVKIYERDPLQHKMSILTVPSKKGKHPPSADVFISWDSATQRAAPPSSDWNARAKWIRPAPRFCLRQKARTAQKRRRPEGQLGTSQVKSQTTLEGSELLPPANWTLDEHLLFQRRLRCNKGVAVMSTTDKRSLWQCRRLRLSVYM